MTEVIKMPQSDVCNFRAYTPEELLLVEAGPWPSSNNRSPQVSSIGPSRYSFECKLVSLEDTVKYTIFGVLLSSIRKCHRRRVMFEEKSSTSQLTYAEFYREHYIRPTLEVFNQIKKAYLETIQYSEVIIDDTTTMFTFWEASGKCHFPTILVLPPGSLDAKLWSSSSIGAPALFNSAHPILSKLEPSLLADTKSIALLTDLRTSVILQASLQQNDKMRLFHREVIEQPDPDERTNRLILAGCVNMRIPFEYLHDNIQESLLPKGAPNNPALPPLSDDEVFSQKEYLSDFDRYTLVNERLVAEQFFRWKLHVHEAALSRKSIPGDILSALTNEFDKHSIPLHNRHPLQPLPPHTSKYLETFRRPFSGALNRMLELSQKFEVRLTRTLKSAEEGSQMAAVYACQLVSVDGQSIGDGMVPELCLKIFDDRLFIIERPKKDNTPVYKWFRDWMTSEDMIRSEEAVYRRLEHAQGSVIPRYFGSHLFTLPDGYRAFGILLEYVTGSDPESGILKDLSTDAQIAFIQSARHAVRVLQRADISQMDWDSSQIICSPAPVASQAPPGSLTSVFVDFSRVAQSDTAYDSLVVDDYGTVLEILSEPSVGLNKELLRHHWEGREKRSYYTTDVLKED